MNLASSRTTGDQKLIESNHLHGAVESGTPNQITPAVLELSGVLQTTLDLQEQLGMFYKEVQHTLDIDGLEYSSQAYSAAIRLGETATHRATYDIRLHQEMLGSLRFHRELPFARSEIEILENLLCALVYPLRNALSYRNAVEMALRDPLTGVQNRAALDSALPREVELSSRQHAPLSLMVLDLDNFKRFNDEYGHSFGDAVLKSVADATANTVRRSDLLFRFGGEEFVVVAAHTTTEGATLLAERIRENVMGLATIRGIETRVTVSVGVATLRNDEHADDLFERADQAMYRAKQNGRNRVVVADSV